MAGQYPAILTEQTRSIKDLLYSQKITPKNFAFAKKREISSGQDRPILLVFARSGSQSEHRIRFILHARGANHIIRQVIDLKGQSLD